MGLIPDPRSQIQITQAKQHCVFFKEKSKIISRKMRRRVCLRHVKLLLSSGIPCTLFDPNEKHQLSIGESSGSTTNAAINNTNLPNNFPRNTALFPLSRMFQFLCSSIIITLCFASTSAFVGSVVNTKRYGKSSVHIKESTTKLDLFLAPQIGFAAACAGAVFAYVYSNIDSIKETQKIATDKAVSEQAASLKSAEAGQRAALEKVKAQQAANIARSKQIAADAKQRADDIGREAAKRR